jgi:ATP-dependent exoDNAse (exonuclease V) beta subunit
METDDASMEFIMRYSDVNESEVSDATADSNFNACLDAMSNIELDEKAEVLFVEEDLRGEIQGYKFRGLIDLCLRNKDTGEIVILDHKSAEYPLKLDGTVKANKVDVFEKHKTQLYLYAELYKINFGV